MRVEVRGRPRAEPPRVQILVVVANIQTGTLKAEVEKGSTGTSLERGSVGPKRRDSSRLKRVCDTNSRVSSTSTPAPRRKGIGLTFPNSDAENGLSPRGGGGAATRTKRGTLSVAPGRVLFSL